MDENNMIIQSTEEKSVRKKIVKRFAIIFFIVLIVLTFFSNTIMNRSLPEVETVMVYNGSVSQKVRCQGDVEISADQELTVSGTRTVKEVLVESGDTVKKGDVIMTFEDFENSELKEAEDALEEMEFNYQKSQMKAGNDYSEDEAQIKAAKAEVTQAEEGVKKAKESKKSLKDAKKAMEEAEKAYNKQNKVVSGLQTKVDSYTSIENYDGEEDMDELISQLSEAREKLTGLEAKYNKKKAKYDDLASATSVDEAEAILAEKKANVESMELALANKKKSDNIESQSDALDDQKALKEIEEQRKKIEKLKEKDDFQDLKAPEDGLISGITAKAGDTVTSDVPIGAIQLEGSGYEVTCSVTKNEAKVLKVGNAATIENLWFDDTTAEIKSIKPDPENPNQQSIVKFKVEGYVDVGQTLQFAVGEKSGKYDTVIPNSALKEDADGYYVLVIKVKATPLGNRYVVRKASVEKLAQDTTNTAISGEVTEYDNVVTNASKPLDNGQQVRLTEN